MSHQELTVLWLSDIHFKSEYRINENVTRLIEDFHINLAKENKDKKISHVVFTGDIAHTAAKAANYTEFYNIMLNRIKEICSDAIFLFVPGNHDVQWANLSQIYSESGKNHEEFFKYQEYIEKSVYDKIFDTFSDRKNSLFPGIKTSPDDILKYDKEGLFGFYYQASINCLFLLINSAYLSYGFIPQKSMLAETKIHIIRDGYSNFISQVIEKSGQLFVEYGNQTYALYLFDEYKSEIDELIKTKHPLVISMAHHPPEWLHWLEKHSSDGESPSPLDDFLFNRSNIHLVGHDHSAPEVGSRFGNKCLMLRSGMFMDDSCDQVQGAKKKGQELFPNNWFSILEITNSSIQHRRFKYVYESGKYSWHKRSQISYSADLGSIREFIFFPKPLELRSEKYKEDKMPPATTSTKTGLQYQILKVDCRKFNYLEFLKIERNIILNSNSEVNISDINLKDLDFRIFSYKIKHKSEKVIRILFNNLESLYTPSHTGMILKEELFQLLNTLRTYHDETLLIDKSTTVIISIFDFYKIYGDSTELSIEHINAFVGNLKVESEAKYNVFKHFFFLWLKKQPELFSLLLDMKFTYQALNYDQVLKYLQT
jgi:hypothetical protein